MYQSKEQIVKLDRKIPFVILYLTVLADLKENGHFGPDSYERDAEVMQLLRN